MIKIDTPVGTKVVRDDQLSVDGRYLEVRDCLNQIRWCAISTLTQSGGRLYGRFGTETVQLTPTIFLETT